MTTILNHGVYGFTEAARLTGLKRSRIREWFSLRPPEKDRQPIFAAEYVANDQDAGIVADWYNIQKSHVMAAVDFEQRLAA